MRGRACSNISRPSVIPLAVRISSPLSRRASWMSSRVRGSWSIASNLRVWSSSIGATGGFESEPSKIAKRK